jgi:hypothetical protein
MFAYNSSNQIINKSSCHYVGDSIPFMKDDSTVYIYENSLLVKEETFYFPSFDRNLFTYDYKNSLLIRRCHFYNQQWGSFTLYDYSGNLCTIETMYDDTINKRIVHYTEHSYENNKLKITDVFDRNGLHIQQIIYTYDEKGNLIVEESKQMSDEITRFLAYVYRYEYY